MTQALSTELKTHVLVFKDKEQMPIMLTPNEADFVKGLWSKKLDPIEIGDVCFSWKDIKRIEKTKNESYKKEYNIGYIDRVVLGHFKKKGTNCEVCLEYCNCRDIKTNDIYNEYLEFEHNGVKNKRTEEILPDYMKFVLSEAKKMARSQVAEMNRGTINALD